MQTILFFDLDATLVSNEFSGKAIRKLLGEMSEAAGKSVEELGREMAAENTRRQHDNPDHPLTMDWNDIVLGMAKRYGVTLSDTVDALWSAYAAADDVVIYDDAKTVLAALKPGRRLVVATKGLWKYQEPVLRVSGLAGYFEDVLTPDRTGFLKTSPGYFAAYIGQQARFIQIGDHYYDDVICAKRNGFTAILRAPIEELAPYPPHERPRYLPQYAAERIATYPAGTDVLPDYVVLSLQEVPDIVRELEAGQKV